MSLYVDASAFVKLYVEEAESGECEDILSGDPTWLTAGHTLVEVRRALVRALSGRELAQARERFGGHWRWTNVLQLDDVTCQLAAEIAEATGVRTLDALHLAAARRAGAGSLPFLTYDLRLAQAARGIGWTVLGA